MTDRMIRLGISALQTVSGLRKASPAIPITEPYLEILERIILMMFHPSDEDDNSSSAQGDNFNGDSSDAFLASICRSLFFLAEECTRRGYSDIATKLLKCRSDILSAVPTPKNTH